MVTLAVKHCSDAQSTKSPQGDCSPFWKTTGSYEPNVLLVDAACY